MDGESHDVVLTQLTHASSVIGGSKTSSGSADDSGMIVTADDGAGVGQCVVKTFSNGSLAKLAMRDGQKDTPTTVGFRDGPNATLAAEAMGQYALVISGHSLVSTCLVELVTTRIYLMVKFMKINDVLITIFNCKLVVGMRQRKCIFSPLFHLLSYKVSRMHVDTFIECF